MHAHSSAGEGGTLDWDTCWIDAVHTHGSDAEGGALTTLAITEKVVIPLDQPSSLENGCIWLA